MTNGQVTAQVCPKCKGRGYITYLESSKNHKDVYGDREFDLEYVRKCDACNGFKATAEDLTNVPDEYREACLPKFNWDIYGIDLNGRKRIAESFFKDFKKWADKSNGLYIYSKTAGSGKTFLACCLGKSVMMKYNLRFKFITAPDYFDKVSEGYALQKQGVGGSSPADIYKECELLVFDDIGAQMDKAWQSQELFKLINERVNRGLVTIYTSNVQLTKLNIDERIKSRILGTTIEFPMPEVPIREIKQRSNQNDFLNKVLKGEG